VKTGFQINYEHSPFLETGKITAETSPNRLNWRCEILLARNRAAIAGKRVLDLASHDGVFSYACLKLGASHVTGVEGRESLIKSAADNLIALGCSPEQFNFVQGDVFDYLKEVKAGEFNTILCFGIIYHTIRQTELLTEAKRIRPDFLILDTFLQRGYFFNPHLFSFSNLLKLISRVRPRHFRRISKSMGDARNVLSYEPVSPMTISRQIPCLVLRPEIDVREWGTIAPLELGAWPTHAFLELMFRSHGFNLERLKWDKKEIKDWTAIGDYKDGRRASYLARPLG
jgi:predicted RNA methylase